MAAPSTALEALTAELLGDVGRLHDDVKAMASASPGAAQSIRASGKEAADSISSALASAVADLTHEAAQREAGQLLGSQRGSCAGPRNRCKAD